jgi:hypothetical protein
MTRTRAAIAAFVVTLAATASGWAILLVTRPEDVPLTEIIPPTLLTGTPLALAAAALAHRAVAAADGRDIPAKILGIATAGLSGEPGRWGQAMRAELASIESRAERAKFAYRCALLALRLGLGAKTWITAAVVGAIVAAGVLLASHASLMGNRAGIGDRTLFLPPVLLFVVGLVYAMAKGSFRTGFQTAVLSLIAALAGHIAMGMAESWRWYHTAGVYLFDGETIKESSALGAALDFVDPFFMSLHLALWLPAAVLGAAVGAWLRKVARATS